MPDKVQPWDRLPEETAQQYSGFECYLQLGPNRSLPGAWYKYRHDLFEEENPSDDPSSAFRKWYRDYHWKERATQWDDHLSKTRRREQEKVVAREARKRTVDTEKLVWDMAEWLEENMPTVRMQFLQKITQEGDAVNPTHTNQAMRVITDQVRMVNEFAKSMGQQTKGPEDDAMENDHVEEILKQLEPSGEEEGS